MDVPLHSGAAARWDRSSALQRGNERITQILGAFGFVWRNVQIEFPNRSNTSRLRAGNRKASDEECQRHSAGISLEFSPENVNDAMTGSDAMTCIKILLIVELRFLFSSRAFRQSRSPAHFAPLLPQQQYPKRSDFQSILSSFCLSFLLR